MKRAKFSSVIRDISAERVRQIKVEGWTPEHDDEHRRGELAMAAAYYAVSANKYGVRREGARGGDG